MKYYKLNDNNIPVECTEAEHSDQYKNIESELRRRVKNDFIRETRIETYFHGYGYGEDKDLPPMLFQTIISEDSDSRIFAYYETWQQAEEGHQKALEWVTEYCAYGYNGVSKIPGMD